MKNSNFKFSTVELVSFCEKWKLKELALFGSILRDDFDPEKSDIDVLITFLPDQHLGWDIVLLKEDLEKIFNFKVDLVTRKSIEKSKNLIRKKEILDNSQIVYKKEA